MVASRRDRALDGVVQSCYSAGDDLDALHRHLLGALGEAVPFDVAFVAAADPDTLLFTRVYADDPLVDSAPRFLDNEFGAELDVNRFVDLARNADPVASLDDAAHGDRSSSARWREIMGPMGMGDELRVALRVDGMVWGFMCLHRTGTTGFDAGELNAMRRIAPHAGEAFRRAAAGAGGAPASDEEAVILVADQMVVAIAGAVHDLPGEPVAVGSRLPTALAAVVRRLEAIERGSEATDGLPAAIRVTSRHGALIAVHAARLDDGSGHGPIVLTLAPVRPSERASLLLAAHGLTAAQRRVATLVLQGLTTGQIVVELRISAHTVQDHLKSVFDKVGVRSRRELVGAMMHRPG